MSERIPIAKSFLEKLLKPVNRLSESCILKSDNSGLYTICSSSDNTVILYAKIKLPNVIENAVRLNLINIKKLLCGLDCLGNDGDFSIECNENNIKCSSTDKDGENTHFKYHLVDDTVIKECPVSINKIADLNFDTEFVDVQSVTLSASSTTPVNVVYDLKDAVVTGTYTVTSNVCTV